MSISKENFETLFYYLDEKLQEHGCQDTRKFTLQFLTDHAINPSSLLTWLVAISKVINIIRANQEIARIGLSRSFSHASNGTLH
ncbi:MAG TPA: DUF2695 domain-containing protein [Candidatus Babeliales bacterium]|nr:DUF2695 domain-containing protein [Candidatus Babeliales bacterium]